MASCRRRSSSCAAFATSRPYLGQEIEAKILELDKNRNNVVLSRRALLEQTQSESRTTFLNNLHKGQVRKGVVSSIVNFGAFVDLGGVDGLVHVSELSWKHIEHASEVVEVGQEVTVEILEVDLERERVSLSLKATQEDPWQVFARTHAIGQVAPGKVTKLVPFGAFVRVAEGIEGLVHISELSGKHVELAEQVVSVGDEVFVKVIDIDLERRRISLCLKQANEGVDPEGTEFDPALYGMLTEYDEQGNYKYPEGFDPETNEWREGFDSQREKWEQEYAAAQARWEAHKKQVAASLAEETTSFDVPAGSSFSSETASAPARSPTTSRSPLCARSSRTTTESRLDSTGRRFPLGEPPSGVSAPAGVSSLVFVFVCGLTGGIAAGKTVVARRLGRARGGRHRRGPARARGRRAWNPGSRPSLERFGAGVIAADGTLDRPRSVASSSPMPKRVATSRPSPTPPSASCRRGAWPRRSPAIPAESSSTTCRCSSRHAGQASSTRGRRRSAPREIRVRRLVDLRGMSDEEAGRRIDAQATDDRAPRRRRRRRSTRRPRCERHPRAGRRRSIETLRSLAAAKAGRRLRAECQWSLVN